MVGLTEPALLQGGDHAVEQRVVRGQRPQQLRRGGGGPGVVVRMIS